jgi:hypothetical protein
MHWAGEGRKPCRSRLATRVGAPCRGDALHAPATIAAKFSPRGRIAKNGYNCFMRLEILAMRVLEVMFFIGLAGSAVVVIISFIEDAKELFGDE